MSKQSTEDTKALVYFRCQDVPVGVCGRSESTGQDTQMEVY